MGLRSRQDNVRCRDARHSDAGVGATSRLVGSYNRFAANGSNAGELRHSPASPCRPIRRRPATAAMPAKRIVPLIVAVALFMENMDSTVIATSLPAIAADIGTSPLALKLAVTSYLLSLAIFIPVSGWTADRFGARTVFRGGDRRVHARLDRLRALGLARRSSSSRASSRAWAAR